ncbi:MAG: PAS domain-containing sensor histidine kinase [Tepidisphaeraceae bacterium]|jgi:signal transduction histidine kinase
MSVFADNVDAQKRRISEMQERILQLEEKTAGQARELCQLRQAIDLVTSTNCGLPVAVYRVERLAPGRSEVRYLSDGILRLTGYPPEDFAADYEGCMRKIHGGGLAAFREGMEAAMARGEPLQREAEITAANGEKKWVWEQALPERRPDGTTVMNGVIIDITERKRAQIALQNRRDADNNELKKALAALQQSERLAAIGTFAAGIAHEINNPVGAILLAARLGSECIGIPDRRQVLADCLEQIAADARRCGNIVTSLLRMARRESTAKAAADVNKAVRAACDLIRTYADVNQISVDVTLGRDLRPVAMNMLEIEHAILNLLRNAIQASSPGSRVHIATEAVSGNIRIVVADRGRGMSEEDVRRVFDPLFSTRQGAGGTGLGMCLASAIVTDHGGSIDVRSRRDFGTVVTISLPALTEGSGPP